jgi:hypothetical protein
MDAVVLLYGDQKKVDFDFHFVTAREAMPETRERFADVKIKLADETWSSNKAEVKSHERLALSATEAQFYDTLAETSVGKKAMSRKAGMAACITAGLVDGGDNPNRQGTNTARALFSRHLKKLIEKNWVIALDDDLEEPEL